MIAIACTCFLLLCDNLKFRPKSKSESENFEVRKKIPTKLESELKKFQVSWISKCQVTPRSNLGTVLNLAPQYPAGDKESRGTYWQARSASLRESGTEAPGGSRGRTPGGGSGGEVWKLLGSWTSHAGNSKIYPVFHILQFFTVLTICYLAFTHAHTTLLRNCYCYSVLH